MRKLKIVYWGIQGCGKTTNLDYLVEHCVKNAFPSITTVAGTEIETLIVPVEKTPLGSILLEFYEAPSQPNAQKARELILEEADGIVFIFDSNEAKTEENKQSFYELRAALHKQRKNLTSQAIVYQFNKQDLESKIDISETLPLFSLSAPYVVAVAQSGCGVFTTFRYLTRGIFLFQNLQKAKEVVPAQ